MDNFPYENLIIFLESLSKGDEITINDKTYVLGFDINNNPRIAHKVKMKNVEGETYYNYIEGLELHDINEFIINVMNIISKSK